MEQPRPKDFIIVAVVFLIVVVLSWLAYKFKWWTL